MVVNKNWHLSDDDIKELDSHGIRYPWEPHAMLAAIRRLEAKITLLTAAVPIRPLCGDCGEPLDPKRNYSDVPTSTGRKNLCLACHGRLFPSP